MTRIVEYFGLALVVILLTSPLLLVAANTGGEPMAPARSGRSRMQGFVVDESGVHGISGAMVELQGDPASARLRSTNLVAATNERGANEFKNVPYGDYLLRVMATDFTTYRIKCSYIAVATKCRSRMDTHELPYLSWSKTETS